MEKIIKGLVNEIKPKIWYDKKANRTGFQIGGKKIYSTCRKEDNYDKYVGAALCIAKDLLGGNKKFREFVDSVWVGEEPSECEYTKEWTPKYEVGDRILFIYREKETIGFIEAIGTNFGIGGYVIKHNDTTQYLKEEYIIRKMRKPNKTKEEKNDSTLNETKDQ